MVEREKTIISVGGGKGGIGKSFITANLGIILASQSFIPQSKVTVVDTDLGGSNLNNFLGISLPRFTLNDFLRNKKLTIEEILEPTPFVGLDLICGADDILNLANLPYSQKIKLLKAFRKIKSDYVVFDLAAGSENKTLDFFNEADIALIVTTPEPISVQNAYGFVRNALFRRIIRATRKDTEIKKIATDYINRTLPDVKDVTDFIERIKMENMEMGGKISSIVKDFRPKLILNQLLKRADIKIAHRFVEVVKRYMKIDMQFLGWLPYDTRVRHATRQGEPFFAKFSRSRTSVHLYSIANLLRNMTKRAYNEIEPAS